jgi:hypothetical protein
VAPHARLQCCSFLNNRPSCASRLSPHPLMHARRVHDIDGISARQLQDMGFSSAQELLQVRDARAAERQRLQDILDCPDVSGLEKQHARCAHIHKHGRLLRQCPGCWLLPGNCVCAKLPRAQPATKVIISVHPDEWFRGGLGAAVGVACMRVCIVQLTGWVFEGCWGG